MESDAVDFIAGFFLTGSTRASEVVVNTKLSLSKIYVPEDDEAVAHGDANLCLSDFLAKPKLTA